MVHASWLNGHGGDLGSTKTEVSSSPLPPCVGYFCVVVPADVGSKILAPLPIHTYTSDYCSTTLPPCYGGLAVSLVAVVHFVKNSSKVESFGECKPASDLMESATSY